MSDPISSFRSGQSGPLVNQTDLKTTDNRVINAKSRGDSQPLAQAPSVPSLANHGSLVDQGAQRRNIGPAANNLITNQLVNKSSSYGEEAAQTEALIKLNGIFNVSESNFCSTMDAFFDAWHAWDGTPKARARDSVLAAGEQLTGTFQKIDQELAKIQANTDRELASSVDALNTQLMNIGDLNTRIVTMEAGGVQANTLREERDQLLQVVAETIGIQYDEIDHGGVSVQLTSGVPLIMSGEAASISSERRDGKTQFSLSLGSTSSDLGSGNLGGKLGGLISVRDETIGKTRAALDQLAAKFAESVNAQFISHENRDGQTGTFLFRVESSPNDNPPWTGAAASISIAITDAVQTGTNTRSGEQTNTLPMVDLREEKTMDAGVTFQEFYHQLATSISIEISRNGTAMESDEDSLIQLQNLQNAMDGVSTDEEMVLLSLYQSGYEAAIKNLSGVQNMLNTLIARD